MRSDAFDLSKWDINRFNTMRSGDPDYLLDVARLNRAQVRRNASPDRLFAMTLNLPTKASTKAIEQIVKDALSGFVEVMSKSGWSFIGPFKWEQQTRAIDFERGVLPDCIGWRITARFRTVPKPVRLELPPGLVRRDEEQVISLHDAVRAARGD